MSKVIHRYVRQPNFQSSVWGRVANRFDPFKNTLTVLQDPQNKRKLYLIGSTNSSTTLAYRTRKLIEDIKPSSVYVQSCPTWWNYAKHIDANNHKEFNKIIQNLPVENFKFENHFRGILFRAKYYSWLFSLKRLARFPIDFNFWRPGLQTKFALQGADKIGAQTVFGGTQFDSITIESLRKQTDMHFYGMLFKSLFIVKSATSLSTQYIDFTRVLQVRGGQAFAESIDRSRANFMVGMINRIAPKQKKILVDQRDQRIFRDLYEKCKGETIVAVVNQWHMQGIETHWRRITGTQNIQHESPIADMDIDGVQEIALVNDYLREFTSQITKSEPATWQNYLHHYHKEHVQNERTRHIAPSSHTEIPQFGETKPKQHHH